jgi:ECF sigma factor
MESLEEITQLLMAWNQGDPEASNRLVLLIYDELHKMAESHMRRGRPRWSPRAAGWATFSASPPCAPRRNPARKRPGR